MITKLIIVIVMGLSGLISGAVHTAVSRTNPSGLSSEGLAPEADLASNSTSPAVQHQGAAEQEGAAAMTRITYDWQTLLLGWTIEFSQQSSGPYGMTFTRDKKIEIYVHPDQNLDHLAHVIAHELGHAVDVTLNTGDDRRAWQQARGIENQNWWPDSGARDFSTGAGDFAESFAYWQLSDDIFRSTLASEPDANQLNLMANLANSN